MTAEGHWQRWHRAYDDPTSALSQRLAIVRRRIGEALDRPPAGTVRVLSACAGDGRDVLDVIAGHARRADVEARLVELDPVLCDAARRRADELGLPAVEVVEADAGTTSVYAGAVPADVVLLCGIFGNITDADVRTTIEELPRLCAAGATVIWTRHRKPPDLTMQIRRLQAAIGCEELAFDAPENQVFGVGAARFSGQPMPFRRDRRLFDFLGDGLTPRT